MRFSFIVKDIVDVLFCYSRLHPGLSWTCPLCRASRPSCVLQALSEVWPFHVVACPKFSPCYQYCSLLSPPDVLYWHAVRSYTHKLFSWYHQEDIIIIASSCFAFSTRLTQWVCFQSPACSVSSTSVKWSLTSKMLAWDTNFHHLCACWDTAWRVRFWHAAFLTGEDFDMQLPRQLLLLKTFLCCSKELWHRC